MPKKSLENLTESMFYVLMAFGRGAMCGIEVADFIEQRTEGRVQMGPATLYTILGKFEQEKYIEEIAVEGRKRTYQITERGRLAYREEVARLNLCVADAAAELAAMEPIMAVTAAEESGKSGTVDFRGQREDQREGLAKYLPGGGTGSEERGLQVCPC